MVGTGLRVKSGLRMRGSADVATRHQVRGYSSVWGRICGILSIKRGRVTFISNVVVKDRQATDHVIGVPVMDDATKKCHFLRATAVPAGTAEARN